MTKKDYYFSAAAGFLIGLLAMPVLQAAKPSLYERFTLMIFLFFLIATPLGLMIAHWIGNRISVVWQIGKFGVIGVLNTLVDWGVLTALILFFRHQYAIGSEETVLAAAAISVTYYTLYKSVSFIVAVINSYYWNKYWTFATSTASEIKTGFIEFFLVSVVGFFINVGVSSYVFKAVAPLGGMTSDQWGLAGAAIGSILGLAWNFVGYKFVVFKNK